MDGGSVMVPQFGYCHQPFKSAGGYDAKIPDPDWNTGQQEMHEPVKLIKERERPSLRAAHARREDDLFTITGPTLAQQPRNIGRIVLAIRVHDDHRAV